MTRLDMEMLTDKQLRQRIIHYSQRYYNGESRYYLNIAQEMGNVLINRQKEKEQ